MTKVYPNAAPKPFNDPGVVPTPNISSGAAPKPPFADPCVVLTVWKKSLLFNCDGFTVFDNQGNLVFRVDNYITGNKSEIVLMDASGNSLFTIRRKRLSLADSWLVFEGENTVHPRFSVTKHMNYLLNKNTKSLAYVTSLDEKNAFSTISTSKKKVIYEMEGSYRRRCCSIYDDKQQRMAEIKRKEAVGGVSFGVDVFRLIVQPHMIDISLAMAFIVLLDQMFGSSVVNRISS